MSNRFKSPMAWSAIFALLIFLAKNYGLLTPLGLTVDSSKELTTLVFAVLTALGIFNNPQNKEGF